MKQFSDYATIPAPAIYRAALVSSTRGDRVVEELRNEGTISLENTPTGRKIFRPRDAEIVFDVLVNGVK